MKKASQARSGRKAAPQDPPPDANDNKTGQDTGKDTGKSASTNDQVLEVTPEELQGMITKSVTDVVAGYELTKGITQEDVAKTVHDVLQAREEKAATRDNILAIVNKAATSLITSAEERLGDKRVGTKATMDDSDAGKAGDNTGRQVEIPVSWCKGNLPLHGKQLLNQVLGKHRDEGIDEVDIVRGRQLGDRAVIEGRGMKALSAAGAGTGLELVPSDLSSELQRRMYLASALYASMAADEVDMPTATYTWPITTTRPTFYLETTENTEATDSTPGTGNVQLVAKKLMGMVKLSYELEEDSIVPVLPWLEQSLAEAAAEAVEDALINGDTTATHMDSDYQAVAKHHARAWNGFRDLAFANAALYLDISSGGLSATNARAMRKKTGKWGRQLQNLFWLVGIKGANDLEGLAEVLTVEKFGPQATITTGRLANLYGIPIIPSAFAREDLNASGVYDGVTMTTGCFFIVNRSYFIMGRRREFMIETERNISNQQTEVVASFRRAFSPLETPGATITPLCMGYLYTA